MNIANTYDTKVETLDFNILEVQTYTRINKEKGEADWEESSEDELHNLDGEIILLNQFFQIKQMYEIEIFSRALHEDPFKDFKVTIGANATKCKVYLSIKEGSRVSFFPNFEYQFLNLINKAKIRAGILISIFDDVLEKAVSKVTSIVRVEENVVYKKNEILLVAQGLEPTPTTNDSLIIHFNKKSETDEQDQVDYASRGFIQSVIADELLIEYIKPKNGKAGRNCRGEFIKPQEPEIKNEPTFTTDDTIKEIEDEDSIKYKAKENGYIALDGTVYTIKADMDIKEVSFKTTGNISAGIDSEVNLSVKEKDVMKDAIGNGMKVEVSEIDIDGNVGSHAIVTAQRANIEGQTHKTAVINAKKIKINTHRGTANGKEISITRLEHGIVNGDTVEISHAVGGEIRAKDITIEVCDSYVKATASRFIEIVKLHGSENVFTIDPLMQKTKKEALEENEEEIFELETSVKNLKVEIEKFKKVIKNDTASFNELKKKLVHYKKNGIKMPGAFVNKYKQFIKVQEHLDTITKEYKVKSDKHTLLTTKTASFQDNIFNARIINRDRWTDHNEIIFRLVEPQIELSFTPLQGSLDKIFGIVETEDGDYEIQAVKE
ncbi:MAG: hypothetical protein COB17_09965 [Sulfurimonas sp.]|nr:MAG: hypothetical protein COB17_09965 [Sulfurimonas sp.]